MGRRRLRLAVALGFLIAAPATLAGSHPNSSPITIVDASAADPYPSTITVSGEGSTLTKVTVGINDIVHTFPDDIDVLLVGPSGANAIIMSDVCGSDVREPPEAWSVTLDDAAILPLLENSVIACPSGTYQPTNSGTGDFFFAPAPAPSGATALSTFNNTNPNGTWRLYIVDDLDADEGSIGQGWTLNITSTGPTAVAVREFSAAQYPQGVVLRWRTAAESSIIGFHVYRASAGKTMRLNRAVVPAKGVAATYRLVDAGVRAGASYTYRLQVVKADRTAVWYGSSSLRVR